MRKVILRAPVAYEITLFDGAVVRFDDVATLDESIVLIDVNPEDDPEAWVYGKRVPHPAGLGTVEVVSRVHPASDAVMPIRTGSGAWLTTIPREFIVSMRRVQPTP